MSNEKARFSTVDDDVSSLIIRSGDIPAAYVFMLASAAADYGSAFRILLKITLCRFDPVAQRTRRFRADHFSAEDYEIFPFTVAVGMRI